MSALATIPPGQTAITAAGTAAMEAYVAAGDIGKLTAPQRVSLYRAVCESLGLNPLTLPFQYLVLSGKTTLYATKSCTEQLRQIHGVSVLRMDREVIGDILTVTVSVRDRSGREDISTGSVPLGSLKGEPLANAHMKCETKAKRRATLSICGLAMLDETEVDSVEGAKRLSIEEVHQGGAELAQGVGTNGEARRGGKATKAAAAVPAASDRVALMDPTPVAAKPAPVVPMPREATIRPKTDIQKRTWKGADMWLATDKDFPDGLLIEDAEIASQLDANQAFGVTTWVSLEERPEKPGRFKVVGIVGDDAIKRAIREGVNRDVKGHKQRMQAYPALTNAELDELVRTIRAFPAAKP